MKSVFIDESGYTGADLLNQDQPFQAASALYLSDSDAKSLIAKHFPRIKSKELKYRDLSRRQTNWNALLDLQSDLLNNYECVSYICDKRFLLILHFIDYAVEPFYYDNGINLYEDGGNYSLASLLYYTGDALLKGDNFREILFLFQHAMKSKTEVSVVALLEKVKASPWHELPEALGPLAHESPSCIEAIMHKDVSTDGAYVVLLSLISRLEAVLSKNYEIIHDRSKNLEQYDITLNKMINHSEEVSFKETEITTIKFPLKLTGVSQIDSKDSPGVQLADVLVGGIIDSSKAITGKKVNDYNKCIVDLYKDNQLIHLLPSLDFEGQKRFRKGTQGSEVIDYFSRHFS
ncbi:DUF3800 domain-containing protein [Vibrio fluvialis]|uniref:DUF3800 domain-containing protein n=1 Tax=Vibrio fluvialis TaxID=676 RepID=UPI0028DDF03F|nr:DUF3800 domain-containing protein [Vibrio fluvialis]MDT8867791.1 DUF3800 domain-containing protein [Vibrio fluvialis]MDT8875148.1 DUF3800 domain-containing protein [Vibrio fluvialis]